MAEGHQLYHACVRNDAESVSKLLPTITGEMLNKQYTTRGETPLFAACELGYAQVVKLLLGHPDIDVNRGSKRLSLTKTPLFGACHKGNVTVVEKLLAHPSIKVNDGWTGEHKSCSPLYVASQKRNKMLISLLLSHPSIIVDEDTKKHFPTLVKFSVEETLSDDDGQDSISLRSSQSSALLLNPDKSQSTLFGLKKVADRTASLERHQHATQKQLAADHRAQAGMSDQLLASLKKIKDIEAQIEQLMREKSRIERDEVFYLKEVFDRRQVAITGAQKECELMKKSLDTTREEKDGLELKWVQWKSTNAAELTEDKKVLSNDLLASVVKQIGFPNHVLSVLLDNPSLDSARCIEALNVESKTNTDHLFRNFLYRKRLLYFLTRVSNEGCAWLLESFDDCVASDDAAQRAEGGSKRSKKTVAKASSLPSKNKQIIRQRDSESFENEESARTSFIDRIISYGDDRFGDLVSWTNDYVVKWALSIPAFSRPPIVNQLKKHKINGVVLSTLSFFDLKRFLLPDVHPDTCLSLHETIQQLKTDKSLKNLISAPLYSDLGDPSSSSSSSSSSSFRSRKATSSQPVKSPKKTTISSDESALLQTADLTKRFELMSFEELFSAVQRSGSIDLQHVHEHLSDKDFERHFGSTKDDWVLLTSVEKDQALIRLGLSSLK